MNRDRHKAGNRSSLTVSLQQQRAKRGRHAGFTVQLIIEWE